MFKGLGCLAILALVIIFVLLGSMFWGWIIMLIAGVFGWNIAFWPQACLLGFLFSCITGGGAQASR